MSFTNPWNDSRQQEALQSPFEPHGESDMTRLQQYSSNSPQRANRIGPIRTMASGEFESHSRSSVSSLSGAMGTASPSQQRPRLSPDHSSNSSPSSDGSNQSHHQRELPLQWDMGLSGVSISSAHSAHAQDLLSPGNTHAALLLEGLDVNRSPYTPSSTLSDLPEHHSAVFAMSTAPYTAPSVGRFYSPHRSSSTNGTDHTSHSMLLPSYPQSAPADHLAFPQSNVVGMTMHNTSSPPDALASASLTSSSEVESMKQYIRELQSQNQELRSRVEQLQSEVTASRFASTMASPADSFANSSYGLSLPRQSQMDASWRRRTEARVRKFCSPNRAGNALCAWHDTRRERRAYPPRMAPAGTLNCGCTVEEALFEESLARHGVGSYLPGDNVRMDPALRNPLLHLLEQRYGYKDGDFEREPVTGQWTENEGPERWEAELQRGPGKAHR